MDAPRFLRIRSPLGERGLIVTELRVTEELGLPYRVEVEALGSGPKLAPDALLTKEIGVTVSRIVAGQTIERFFHGLVSEFETLGPGAAGRSRYRMAAVPGIWRLGLKVNCRIFQDKTVKDIVNSVLQEHGQPAPTWGIVPPLEPIPYCTQFNETDLHFVSRLLEEQGLTYYFKHTASSHTLHISATAPGFPAFEGGDVTALHGSDIFFDLGDWSRANRARSASTKFEDMDKERSQPSVVIKKTSDTRAYPGEPAMWGKGEVFQWPGGMSTRPGLDTAAVSMGVQETTSERFSAEAQDPRFTAGLRMFVSVQAEDGSTDRQQYVVTSVRHQGTDYSGLAAAAGGVETYHSDLELRAASRTWMPLQRHARPVLAGLYSATVTGPSGEKIHVDEFGRIKVRFRWDRAGPNNETSSCWVRVMQAAAGAWGGTWFLPRVGDEVLVAFLDGDPDRPVVVGSVYGKDAKPPFLPGSNRAQSGLRTRSYKSDSAEDANILRFDDKKGSEEVFLHAEKDLAVEVEHDEKRTVQHARTTTIKEADDTLTLDQGDGKTTLKMGDLTITCKMGHIKLEALQSITLKVGQSTVVLDQMGVTVKGMMITEQAQLIHDTKGLIIQEKADAITQVQGGIVMIN